MAAGASGALKPTESNFTKGTTDMAKKPDIAFSIASLDKLSDKKLDEITNRVLASKKGASAMRSMVRSVMRSALKSTVKSIMKSPLKAPVKSPVKSPMRSK
jgi:hypothetical protein